MDDPTEPGDPTEQSLWRPLRLLLDAMDADIARIYGEADIEGLKPSWPGRRAARTRRRAVADMAAEWRATEAAAAEVEAEIPYPLSQVVTDITAALARKSFHDRIAQKLSNDPNWDYGENGGRSGGARGPRQG